MLVVCEKHHVELLKKVLTYSWLRLVDLDSYAPGTGYPTPPGKRLVSDAAWEVLRLGAQIPTETIENSLGVMGTRLLSSEQQEYGERWSLAELERRRLGQEDFDT